MRFSPLLSLKHYGIRLALVPAATPDLLNRLHREAERWDKCMSTLYQTTYGIRHSGVLC